MTDQFLSDDELARIDAGGGGHVLDGGAVLPAGQRPGAPAAEQRRHQTATARPLGHVPGLGFVYAHMSRLIRERDLDAVYFAGPATAARDHGGVMARGHVVPGLPGYPAGRRRHAHPVPSVQRARRDPEPRAVSRRPGPSTKAANSATSSPHAFGAAFDNPDLISLAIVGDGEAETGPLEGSWKGISFLNPVRDGAVLPVLHLNGYKIAGPTVLARKDPADLRKLLEGHGYEVIEVEGDDIPGMHHRFAQAIEHAVDRIKEIQDKARNDRAPRASRGGP